MSHIRRFWIPATALNTLGWDKGDVELVRAKDFDALQEELTIIRPERDVYKASSEALEDTWHSTEKELAMWKANHANMVERTKLLRERPDLPVDRLPAYRRMEALQLELTEQKNQRQWWVDSAIELDKRLTAAENLLRELDARHNGFDPLHVKIRAHLKSLTEAPSNE